MVCPAREISIQSINKKLWGIPTTQKGDRIKSQTHTEEEYSQEESGGAPV